jgi:RRXRR protein
MRVPVIDQNHQPLMPTTPARARKWVKSGKAIRHWSDSGQYYVQLVSEPSGREVQSIVIGIDPGKLYSGVGVQSAKFTLYTAHLVLPFKTVKDRMETRRIMRRSRRGRRINRKVEFSKRAHRQKRFDNRGQSRLPPSIRANRQLELRIVSELCKIYPISEIRYEHVKARGNKGFSPVMVGQKWMLIQLADFAPVSTVFGWETANMRGRLGLEKQKSNKSSQCFETHAVDGVAIAASSFVQYKRYHRLGEDGAEWVGDVEITKAPFFVIKRPPYSRRQLHLMVPAKGGERRKYGGSTTSFDARKGDLVQSPKGIGYISGETGNSLSISDSNWKRLGRVTAKKVQIIRRNNGLLVA